mmetsp:Transcript_62048/g.183304  ORF Transcript_62048/g.183304 Transcript_62048/m.183304 type:complete len:295 (-) Transcript_62048:1343-2227(-)
MPRVRKILPRPRSIDTRPYPFGRKRTRRLRTSHPRYLPLPPRRLYRERSQFGRYSRGVESDVYRGGRAVVGSQRRIVGEGSVRTEVSARICRVEQFEQDRLCECDGAGVGARPSPEGFLSEAGRAGRRQRRGRERQSRDREVGTVRRRRKGRRRKEEESKEAEARRGEPPPPSTRPLRPLPPRTRLWRSRPQDVVRSSIQVDRRSSRVRRGRSGRVRQAIPRRTSGRGRRIHGVAVASASRRFGGDEEARVERRSRYISGECGGYHEAEEEEGCDGVIEGEVCGIGSGGRRSEF